jgi:dephospho-CoA kinase
MKKKARLIGLTGTNGAGKGEAATFFVNNGYAYLSLSDLIREELQKKGQEVTRNNLIKMGNRLREKSSPDILARMVVKKIKGKAVIDSIRNSKEIEFLKKQEGFVLLSLDAPPELRFRRVQKRGREESAANLQEFLAKEAQEMNQAETGQQLLTCMKMADFRIWNDGTLEELYEKLEKFL